MSSFKSFLPVQNTQVVTSPVEVVSPVQPEVVSTSTATTTVSPAVATPSVAETQTVMSVSPNMIMSIFVLVSVVVIILLGFIAKYYKDTHDSLCVSSWNSQPLLGGILLFISLLISAFYAGKGYLVADSTTRNLILIFFAAIMILVIIAFVLFFRKGNYSSAFYISLVIVACSFVLAYLCAKYNRTYGYGQIPLFVMSVVLAAYFYDVTSKNENNVGEIDGVASTKDCN